MSQIDSYVNQVVSYIDADKKMKMRIKADLTAQMNDAAESENIEDVIRKMGDPGDVAQEFMDSINDGKGEFRDDFRQGRMYGSFYSNRIYEYKSKATFLGIPLVHVKLSRYGKPAVAKGIIAIGTVSVGVVSIGALPVGIISLGGAAIGLVSLGGLAIGLLMALGGVAVGVGMAVGGIAIGLGALGGFAIGEIAYGGYARGTVAIGAEAIGKYSLVVHHTGPETKEAVENMIKSAFPGLPDWIAHFFSSINANLNSN